MFKNPFSGSQVTVTKCIDESKLTVESVKLLLEELSIEDENEFYVLFTSGILIRKKRSEFKTSDYIRGIRKSTKIREYYDGKV